MIRGALAALIITLSLAGCSASDNARVVPVEDRLDGMVTDVVRLDVEGGFIPMSVGPDGAVVGTRKAGFGPPMWRSSEVVLIEPNGDVVPLMPGKSAFAFSAAVSETTVTWVAGTFNPEDLHLYVTPRDQPQARDITDLVEAHGSTVNIFPGDLWLVGDSIVASPNDWDNPHLLVIDEGDKVSFLPRSTWIGGVTMNHCAAPERLEVFGWEREQELPVPVQWHAVLTSVSNDRHATDQTIVLQPPLDTDDHQWMVGVCDTELWYLGRYGDARWLIAADAESGQTLTHIALPERFTALTPLHATPSHVVMVIPLDGLLVAETQSGRTATLDGSTWCGSGAVNGDYMVWQEHTGDQGPYDGSLSWSCQTFVGRLANAKD